MRSYIYPLTADECKQFEATGMIDYSRSKNEEVVFFKGDEIFICDVDKRELMGPFHVLFNEPKNYLGLKQNRSRHILCSMDAPIYHMDWDIENVGWMTAEYKQAIRNEIDSVNSARQFKSVTGDSMVDGLLAMSSLKDFGSFRGIVLTFQRNSPLIGYFTERLTKCGIKVESDTIEIRILGDVDERVFDLSPEDYPWDVEFMAGIVSQFITQTPTRSLAETPDRYTFNLYLLGEDFPPEFFLDQKQALFTKEDSYGRLCISNICFGMEPFCLFHEIKEMGGNGNPGTLEAPPDFQFIMALNVLENIFAFNGCHIIRDELDDCSALLSITNGEVSVRALVVPQIDGSTGCMIKEYGLDPEDVIFNLKRIDEGPAPSWIKVGDLRDYLEDNLLLIPRLGINPILNIDPSISDALSDKLDLIWG